ncbi:DUF721 domain-containing protein [Streptomyces sp. NPDC057545]|uniref:DUF721 domain-containing protein n=1 Tax=Streptomyces sp. NPDC057545 TaxID=3346164 RepID=UPI0036CB50C8
MAAPAAGGSVLAHFEVILAAAVPELSGPVRAVAFDAETGRLDVVPDAPAVGTQLRWSAPKLIAAANERVSGANVRALHVLAPAPLKAGRATAAAAPSPPPTTSAAPAPRPAPSDGYRRAIKAHRAAGQAGAGLHDASSRTAIAEAVERQTAAMRELSRRAFPEPDAIPDDARAPLEQARPAPPPGRGDRSRRPAPRPRGAVGNGVPPDRDLVG